jgi:thiol-disulfide isomerase/thioredoxin
VSEPVAKRPRFTIARLGLAALVIAGLAIAITYFVSNAGSGSATLPCAPQAAQAKVIDTAATGQLAALNGTGTGRGYADMSFTDASGKPVKLSDFVGKTLLVNFWASWCVPCRAEMPALDKVAAQYNDANFMVLPINLDTGPDGLDKARKFMAEGAFKNLPLYADSSFAAFKRLQTTAVAAGLPTTLLLDRKGCEIGVLQGPAVWDSPDGDSVIKALKSI